MGRIRLGTLPALAVAYAAGVVFAAQLTAPSSTALAAALFPAAAAALVCARHGWRGATSCFLFAAFVLAGMLRMALASGPGAGDGPCATRLAAIGLPAPNERAPARLRIEALVEEVAFREGRGVAEVAIVTAAASGPGGDRAGPGGTASVRQDGERPTGAGVPIVSRGERRAGGGDAVLRQGDERGAGTAIVSRGERRAGGGDAVLRQGDDRAGGDATAIRSHIRAAANALASIPAGALGARLFLPEGLRPFPGDRLLLEATLDELRRDGPAGDAPARALAARGIVCEAKVHERRAAVIEPAGGWRALVEAERRRIGAAIRARLEDGPGEALIPALALGDREDVGADQAERFADSGLAHILSVSGLHLGLTVLVFFRALAFLLARSRLAERLDPLRAAALASLPLAPAYALLTGATPPVNRAAIAAGLFLIATASGRAPDAASALGAALLALLALDPHGLFDVSLQLSFAACWGLVALVRPLRAALPIPAPPLDAPRWRRWIEAPIAALVTTAAATAATLPLTALHFERFSLASLPANVVAVPVALVATLCCAAATAAGLVWEAMLGVPLAVALPATRLLDALAAHFATWPGARVQLGRDAGSLAALALVPLFMRLLSWRRRVALAGIVAAVAAVAILRLPPAPDGRLHVEFLPVGQGDSTLLVFPDGSAVLVDAGGDLLGNDVAKRRVLPWLRRRGIDRLAAVAVSHLHPDHAGGVPDVLRALDVDELWTSGRPLEGRWGAPIAAAAAERGVAHRRLGAGEVLEMGGVRIEVLGPPDIDGKKDDPLLGDNDASLVLRLVHGEVAVLLPGDVEEIGELALLESGADLRADLLKAPHHGSRTSSTPPFVEAVDPAHVVFCVGHRNRFGFPHDDVVARWRAAGAQVHRTDEGPIRFVSGGSALWRL